MLIWPRKEGYLEIALVFGVFCHRAQDVKKKDNQQKETGGERQRERERETPNGFL